jgi:Nucleotidyl transferase AbiEii toxin, Type IV TA system
MPESRTATKKRPSAVFLHDHPNFLDLIRQVAQQEGIAPYLIEKDYWLMHGLWCLQQQGWTFQLKGGTSLSKGHKLIQRFSEDIDLRIEPPADRVVPVGKNHDKPAHIQARKAYFDWLSEQLQARPLPGFSGIERAPEFDDNKYRSAGIRMLYPVATDQLRGIKEGILLEVGFDDTAPNHPCDISSWALDVALKSPIPFIDNRALAIPCYSPAYTFVEKLQTVSTKFRNQQDRQAEGSTAAESFPKNFLRHYYDLYCLLQSPEVQAFIGTPEYQDRKRVRFPKADNLDIASNEAFLLSDPQVRQLYARKYEETQGLYYTGQVPFDEILQRIALHIARL